MYVSAWTAEPIYRDVVVIPCVSLFLQTGLSTWRITRTWCTRFMAFSNQMASSLSIYSLTRTMHITFKRAGCQIHSLLVEPCQVMIYSCILPKTLCAKTIGEWLERTMKKRQMLGWNSWMPTGRMESCSQSWEKHMEKGMRECGIGTGDFSTWRVRNCLGWMEGMSGLFPITCLRGGRWWMSLVNVLFAVVNDCIA